MEIAETFYLFIFIVGYVRWNSVAFLLFLDKNTMLQDFL